MECELRNKHSCSSAKPNNLQFSKDSQRKQPAPSSSCLLPDSTQNEHFVESYDSSRQKISKIFQKTCLCISHHFSASPTSAKAGLDERRFE
jgi:hypothetical protein